MNHNGRSIQLPLMRAPFEPMSHGPDHYLVAVQNRKGERDALSHLDAATWEQTTPLMHFAWRKAPGDTLKGPTVAGWVADVAAIVGERPCFVDVLRLRPTHQVEVAGKTEPLLKVIHDACRRRGMQFVPVLHVGEGADRLLKLVGDAATEDGRGVCLRYDAVQSVSASGLTIREVFESTLIALGAAVADTDVILDMGWLDPDTSVDAEAIAQMVRDVCAVGWWRSLVLLGTSIPAAMGCVPEGTVGAVPRREWRLWRDLHSLSIDRLPSFGDYGVQHPKPPFGPGGFMRANVRYTAAESTIIARGVGLVVQEGSGQYRELCERLLARPEFCGREYTWGDGVIADCADGVIAPGAQDMWRGAGCSHHVRFVTEEILSAGARPN